MKYIYFTLFHFRLWNISDFEFFRFSTWNCVKLFLFRVEIESKFTLFHGWNKVKWYFFLIVFMKYVENDSKLRFFLFHFFRNFVKSIQNRAKSLTNRNLSQFQNYSEMDIHSKILLIYKNIIKLNFKEKLEYEL